MDFERIKEENNRKVEHLQIQKPDSASANLNNTLEFAQKVDEKTISHGSFNSDQNETKEAFAESNLIDDDDTSRLKEKQLFTCDQCSDNERFQSHENLMNHIKSVHEKVEESYDCSQCCKSFRKLKYLKAHVKGVHGKSRLLNVTNVIHHLANILNCLNIKRLFMDNLKHTNVIPVTKRFLSNIYLEIM